MPVASATQSMTGPAKEVKPVELPGVRWRMASTCEQHEINSTEQHHCSYLTMMPHGKANVHHKIVLKTTCKHLAAGIYKSLNS
jgi:hypothetical protein